MNDISARRGARLVGNPGDPDRERRLLQRQNTLPLQPRTDQRLAEQVHQFCGRLSCLIPPPDTVPRALWKGEVERGLQLFFGKPRLPLTAAADRGTWFVTTRSERPAELDEPRIERADRAVGACRWARSDYPRAGLDAGGVQLAAGPPLSMRAGSISWPVR